MRRLALQVLRSRLIPGLFLVPALALAEGPVVLGQGTASYYRPGYVATTSSGEPYHPELFTAAHASLAMGSWVRVTNLKTGQSVLVRVNDRSPFVAGNLIDVSLAAAEKLDLLKTGYAEVSLAILESPGAVNGGAGRLTPVSGLPPSPAVTASTSAAAPVRPVFRIQFATYHELSPANRDQAELRGQGVDTVIYRRENAGAGEPLFRLVTSGGFADQVAAERWLDYIKRKAGRYPDACVSP
ncbi:MAG: Rare lipoprotein A, peptidoglycan hydrolase [Verrucomicrobia bacterium]|jgi:rare lipoprotein A|nr:MAG: Rare lipoprotein A, peptidoglycan hydrolase [Verrucomicrobiota bacterium]